MNTDHIRSHHSTLTYRPNNIDKGHPQWVERSTDQDEVVLLGRVQESCPSKLSVKTTVCGDGGRCDTES